MHYIKRNLGNILRVGFVATTVTIGSLALYFQITGSRNPDISTIYPYKESAIENISIDGNCAQRWYIVELDKEDLPVAAYMEVVGKSKRELRFYDFGAPRATILDSPNESWIGNSYRPVMGEDLASMEAVVPSEAGEYELRILLYDRNKNTETRTNIDILKEHEVRC